MQTDDQNPGSGGAGKAIEPTPEQVVPQEPATPTGDPLDDIQDPEARAEAKRVRAISRRNKEDKQAPPAAPSPSTGEFVRKDDVARMVTNQAKELVSDEVRAQWDTLLKDVPLGGYDPLDARSIAQNMNERFALHTVRKGEPKPIDPSKDLQTTPGIRGTTGPATPPAAKPEDKLPNFTLPRSPIDWYKPKQS